MIKELAHVCFTVKDLDASLAFYTGTLGCAKAFDFIKDTGERYGAYVKIGHRSFIELFRAREITPSDSVSYRHLCLEVDDLPATVTDLRAKGVPVTDPKLGLDNSWQAWLADPDGNKIELHQYTATSWQAPHLR